MAREGALKGSIGQALDRYNIGTVHLGGGNEASAALPPID
jgi:hypothetical protein